MGQKKGRAAQVWAVQVATGISQAVRAGASLPFVLPPGELFDKGSALRRGQEVNYAKKKEEEKGAPRAFWTLKGVLQEGGKYQMMVVSPQTRVREVNEELYAGLGTTLAGLADLANAPTPPAADIPARLTEASPEPAHEPDAQEKLLKDMYGLE